MSAAEEMREVFRAESVEIAAAARKEGLGRRHGPSIGTAREDLLTRFLAPKFTQFRFRRGEIRSSMAGPSSEWDIVVCDDSAGGPLVEGETASLIPIESVVAVVSVKSELRTTSVADCARDAHQLRGIAGRQIPGRSLPPVFLFGYQGLSNAALIEALQAGHDEHGTEGAIDAAVVLGGSLGSSSGAAVVAEAFGDDAWFRWVIALDHATASVPRQRVSLGALRS